jgi:hypothetical protein
MTLVNVKFFYFQLQALLTSIVLKRNVTMLDIVSTRMLGQFGFLAKVRKLMTMKPILLVDESLSSCFHIYAGVFNIRRFRDIS